MLGDLGSLQFYLLLDLPSVQVPKAIAKSVSLFRKWVHLSHREDSMHAKLLQSCPTLCDPTDCSPWDSPGKNTEVGCHFLLQGIFPVQGSNWCLTSPASAGGFFTSSAIWEESIGDVKLYLQKPLNSMERVAALSVNNNGKTRGS